MPTRKNVKKSEFLLIYLLENWFAYFKAIFCKMQFRIFSRQVLDISRAKWYEFMKFSWTFFLKKKIEMNAEFFLEKKTGFEF